jgi:hypothetical protein
MAFWVQRIAFCGDSYGDSYELRLELANPLWSRDGVCGRSTSVENKDAIAKQLRHYEQRQCPARWRIRLLVNHFSLSLFWFAVVGTYGCEKLQPAKTRLDGTQGRSKKNQGEQGSVCERRSQAHSEPLSGAV